jgi:hypothetical protein
MLLKLVKPKWGRHGIISAAGRWQLSAAGKAQNLVTTLSGRGTAHALGLQYSGGRERSRGEGGRELCGLGPAPGRQGSSSNTVAGSGCQHHEPDAPLLPAAGNPARAAQSGSPAAGATGPAAGHEDARGRHTHRVARRGLGRRREQWSWGTLPRFRPDPGAPYAHPAFWAPFVLVGNWR